MSQEKYIAAIEICSSKIIGAVGRANAQGKLDVIAVEQEPIVECVYHGIIHNVEETASTIASIISRLEARAGVAPRKIQRLYVGLSGRSLRNIPREITRNLPEDTEITEELLANIREEARRSNIDSSLEVIDAIPCTYFINKTETKSPVGNFGSNLRVIFQIIAARPLLTKHLRRVIKDKVGLDIAEIVITPLAVGSLALSPDERRLGCMLADMGAQTTTVSIYQNGALHHLAVLPMGSQNITRDITSLNMLEKYAEEIKTNQGNAIPGENSSSINVNGVRYSDVANLIVARSEEIVANIIEQINYAGITNKQLPGGIITVGGGFNLNRMGELLHRQSSLNVRRGALPQSVTLEDTKAPTYETIEVVSIMSAGLRPDAPECLEIPHREELPDTEYVYEEQEERHSENRRLRMRHNNHPRRNGFLSRIQNALSNIIPNTKDDDGDTEID